MKGRVEFPELKRQVASQAAAWHPSAILVEDSAPGQSLIQELCTTNLPILPVKADSDKISRAQAVTPLIESGRVFLPQAAGWLPDFLDELAAFPNAAHDDQVDSVTQALNYLRLNSGGAGIQFVRQPRRWPDRELPERFPEPFHHESLFTKIL
jgi:predicted phage terminase large subunit-like protein